jgi:hypothetical protein
MRGERSRTRGAEACCELFDSRAAVSKDKAPLATVYLRQHCHSIGYRAHIVRCDVTLRRSAVIAHDATCARGGQPSQQFFRIPNRCRSRKFDPGGFAR